MYHTQNNTQKIFLQHILRKKYAVNIQNTQNTQKKYANNAQNNTQRIYESKIRKIR